jgi:hypothetical protein
MRDWLLNSVATGAIAAVAAGAVVVPLGALTAAEGPSVTTLKTPWGEPDLQGIWTAGIIGDARVRTVLAALDMTAEGGSATNLDRPHDASLVEAHVAGVGHAPRLTMAAEYIRDLQLRSPRQSGAR